MISASVRDKLQAAGQSVSLKQLALDRGLTFPLSVRSWLDIPPAGRIARRTIPIPELEQMFNDLFNPQGTPWIKLLLHGTEFGQSDLTFFEFDPTTGYRPIVVRDMGHLEFELTLAPDPDYHFNNLESEGISVTIRFAERVRVDIRIDFETANEEIKVNNFPNLNFTEFNITLSLELDFKDGAIDLLKWIDTATAAGDHVSTRVGVAAHTLPDGMVRRRVRNASNSKVFDALKDPLLRFALKEKITPVLVGGDFHVIGIDSNDQAVFIDYVIPPGQG